MAQTNDVRTGVKPPPLMISRTFAARRELVFKAWSTADHMQRWFSPEGYTVPEAEVDFRPGGACVICMRSPDGQDFWSRGHYIEIAPPERLVFTSGVTIDDVLRFTAHTTVTFEAVGPETRMTVRQDYEIFDPAFADAVTGAAEGWRTTLDKLEQEIARMHAPDGRTVAHGTFTVEHTYGVSPSRVFQAFTDKTAKSRWFGDPQSDLERVMDVRPGGRERLKARWPNGTVSTFDAVYFDIVPDARLVYAYEMHLNERKISVSLATVEFRADGTGTRLIVTEQGAFLDGHDDAGSRERGTAFLLGRLGASLDA